MYIAVFFSSLLLYLCGVLTNKKFFFYLLALILVFFCGLRAKTVGRDTPYYHWAFHKITTNPARLSIQEKGYYKFIKFIDFIGGTQQLVFLIFALATVLCYGKFILKYCKEPYLALLIFIFVGPYYLALFNQMRQYLAVGIFLGYLIPAIQERKFIKFIIITILTSYFVHQSVLVLIPFYFVLNKKIPLLKKITYLLGFNLSIGLIIFIISKTHYYYFIANRSNVEVETSMLLIQLVIGFLIILLEYRFFTKNKEYNIFFNMSLFSLMIILPIILSSSSSLGEVFLRINNYFFPFMIVLIPNLFSHIFKKLRNACVFVFIILISLYYIRSTYIRGEFYDLAPYEYNLNLFS